MRFDEMMAVLYAEYIVLFRGDADQASLAVAVTIADLMQESV